MILLSNPFCPNSCMWPLQFASWIVILSDSDWIRINLQIKWAPFLKLLLHFHHGERARARARCRAHPIDRIAIQLGFCRGHVQELG